MKTEGLNVLIVDDNGMNRKIFSMLIKKMESNVTEAAGGEQCLQLAEGQKYDIIFMDHLMPEMDGIETLKRMKSMEVFLNADTPVIALTANDVDNGREFYMEAGFDGYLEKPVLAPKLEELIKQL